MNKFLVFFLLIMNVFNSYAKSPPTTSEIQKEMVEDKAIHKISYGVFYRAYKEMSYSWKVAETNTYCGKLGISKAI